MVNPFFRSDMDKGESRQDWPEIHGNFTQLSLVCRTRQLAAKSPLLEVDSLDAKCVTQCGCKQRVVRTGTREEYFILEGKISISEIPTGKPSWFCNTY